MNIKEFEIELASRLESVLGWSTLPTDIVVDEARRIISQTASEFEDITHSSNISFLTATGFYVRSSKNCQQVVYKLDDNSIHTGRKFKSRRLAKVAGKRSWKGMCIVDYKIKPIPPLKNITLNTIVKDQHEAESNLKDIIELYKE